VKHATRWLMACIGGLTLCAAAPISLGQPDGPRPADEAPRGEGAPDEAVRRERARQLITERLKRLEDNQKLLRESLDMLDRGESLDAVREHGRAALGERAERFREGGPRMGGPGNLGPPGGPGGPDGPGEPGGPGPGGRRGGGHGERRGGDIESFDGPGGMGDGPEGRGGSRERDPVTLSPEERTLIIDMLLATRPGLGERLARVQSEKPGEFDAMIQRSAPQFLRMIDEKRRDPAMFEAKRAMFETEFAARRLAREVRAGGKDPTPEQIDQLKAALHKQYDARLKVEEEMLRTMREQIAKSEERRQKMDAERDAHIEKGLKELLERDGEDRPGGPGTRPPPQNVQP
jgi:hypothetical protein